MLCALEAKETTLIAELDKLAEEAAERKRIEDEIAHAEERAVFICETFIADKIAEKAKNRESSCTITFRADEIQGEIYGRKLGFHKWYANGTMSKQPIEAFFKMSTVIDYLRNHCYNVEFCNSGYMYYGFGYQDNKAIEVKISW